MSLLQFRAWVKPDILINHLNGVIAEALPNFIYDHCLVLREDLVEDKQFEEILDFLDIELMQSTTLKDKNGVEIFEGDVVITSKGAIGYVAYLQQEAGFVVVLKKSDYRLGHRNTGESYDVATAHEVIGNIYENSELLEVE
ncbi:TPA: YopX family protein [Enterococcus faecium]